VAEQNKKNFVMPSLKLQTQPHLYVLTYLFDNSFGGRLRRILRLLAEFEDTISSSKLTLVVERRNGFSDLRENA